MTNTEPFRVVVSDPPWKFGDSLPGKTRGASKNYRCLSLDEIKAFPLPPIADDALLFLWRVSAMVPEAYAVVKAWGFEAKAELVWEKLARGGGRHFGMGRYVRNCHETCIIASRGKSIIQRRDIRSVFNDFVGEHSTKPSQFYRIVQELAPGPYLELFARQRREGWTCVGDELPARAAE